MLSSLTPPHVGQVQWNDQEPTVSSQWSLCKRGSMSVLISWSAPTERRTWISCTSEFLLGNSPVQLRELCFEAICIESACYIRNSAKKKNINFSKRFQSKPHEWSMPLWRHAPPANQLSNVHTPLVQSSFLAMMWGVGKLHLKLPIMGVLWHLGNEQVYSEVSSSPP